MNREKELATNTAILTIGKICTQFVSFFLLPLYTALLVPEEFGIVDLFNTYIALLLPLFNWQFESGLFRFLVDFRNDKIKQKTIISTVLISNIAQSIIYLTVFMCIQQYIVNRYKIFLAIDVVLSIFLNTLMQIPRGMGKNGTYTVASFISAVSAVGFNVLFIAGLKYGALGMFLGTTSAKVITMLKKEYGISFQLLNLKKKYLKKYFIIQFH